MAKGCESLQFRNVREGFGGKGIGLTWRQFLRNKEVVVFLVREFRWKIGGFVCLVKEKRQERFMFYKEKEIERRENFVCVCNLEFELFRRIFGHGDEEEEGR